MRIYHVVLLAFVGSVSAGAGAPSDADMQVLKSQIQSLERQLEMQRQQFEKRLDDQRVATNDRFADIAMTNNKVLAVVGLFGTLGSVFAFTTWFKGRADYLNERQGQMTLVGQQVDIGTELLKRSKDFVDNQIDSVGKLRNVIGLVADSFKLQVDREKGLAEFTELAKDLNEHFRASYGRARDAIMSLNVTRMGWASLNLTQYRTAERARAEFRSIPESYLRHEESERPFELAEICQRIGTSAFYANDVDYARSLLTRSWDTYKKQEDAHGTFPDAHLVPRATAAFFLGLIGKNWIGENQDIADGVVDAKKWLLAAQDVLGRNKKKFSHEFQIPVTLCEVLSYLEATRSEAEKLLGEPMLGGANSVAAVDTNQLIPRLEGRASLDDNQRKLLGRACLLRGNIEENASRSGTRYYEKALEYDPNNPYTMLALALSTNDPSVRNTLFTKGLAALDKTPEKQEVTTRALAMVWSIIAAHELGERSRRDAYLLRLEAVKQSGSMNAGGREPLFFDPLRKEIVRFDHLLERVRSHVVASASII